MVRVFLILKFEKFLILNLRRPSMATDSSPITGAVHHSLRTKSEILKFSYIQMQIVLCLVIIPFLDEGTSLMNLNTDTKWFWYTHTLSSIAAEQFSNPTHELFSTMFYRNIYQMSLFGTRINAFSRFFSPSVHRSSLAQQKCSISWARWLLTIAQFIIKTFVMDYLSNTDCFYGFVQTVTLLKSVYSCTQWVT